MGKVHINLESLMVSNPTSVRLFRSISGDKYIYHWQDPMAHFRWLLYFYCELHSVYDAATCAAMYAKLPECLDLIEKSLQVTGFSENANAARRAALEACYYIAWGGDTHGVMVEDVRQTVGFFMKLQSIFTDGLQCSATKRTLSSASLFFAG
jgi:hypothetical protein